MSAHTDPNEPRLAEAEPPACAEAIRIILAALVTGGWLTVDSATVNWLVTGVGLIVSVVATVWTRRKVTPSAAPRDPVGRPLTPAAPPVPPDPPTAP